jgi:hypothetical protein
MILFPRIYELADKHLTWSDHIRFNFCLLISLLEDEPMFSSSVNNITLSV